MHTLSVMYILRSSFNITASNFTKNCAHYGRVIPTYGSNFSVISSHFVQNTVYSGVATYLFPELYSDTSSGGVMYIEQSSFSIASSIFAENRASYCGGAIYIDQRSLLSVTVSSFTNNRASYGGAIFIMASSFEINTTNFTQNSAWSGGVLFILESFAFRNSIASNEFTENSATHYGGVVFLSESLLHISTSVFDRNGVFVTCFDNEAEHNNTSDHEFDSFTDIIQNYNIL